MKCKRVTSPVLEIGLWSLTALLISYSGAAAQVSPPSLDPALVQEGKTIFNTETFNGNGRTCASCHPADNNFTLSPSYIASLPADDPLFVAEFDPDLASLENPVLMRGPRALILENIDGFDKPPVFRGTPHILDVALSAPYGLSSKVPTLRDFSLGATIQHFPKTLNRVAGVDFRVPTDHELDALEAYQLSVFSRRDFDYDLDRLVYTPAQQRGRDLFFGSAKCSQCHNGPALGGGSGPGGKTQFDVGIAELPNDQIPAACSNISCIFFAGLVDSNPRSAPFCPSCSPLGPMGPLEEGGRREFDIPPLFGIPQTGPYFHDNSRPNLERAVNFYDSPFFQASPAGQLIGGISLTPQQISDLTSFMGALATCGNAVDGVPDRSCSIRTARCPIAAGSDDGELDAAGSTYPPLVATQRNVGSGIIDVRRNLGASPPFTVNTGFLRWNTADCLPPNATVVGAKLRLVVTSILNANSRALTADWFNWSPDIGSTDYSPTAQTNALSPGGACGSACNLSSMPINVETDFTLDNVASINVIGLTHLRLHMSGDVPTGRNEITVASFENVTFALEPPQLIIDYTTDGTIPPSPTNTSIVGPTSTPTAIPTATNTSVPTATRTFTSTPAPTNTPTATVAGAQADLVEATVSNPPATVAIAHSFAVTDTVRNQGTAAAAASTTRYVLSLNGQRNPGRDFILAGQRNVPSLNPGQQSGGTVTVTIQNTTVPGTYFLLACADTGPPGGVVVESNENNNCTSSTTVVVVGP
jgi:cytochrome c peroxidase